MADHDAGDGAEEEWRFPLSELEDGDGDAVDAAPDEPADPDAADSGTIEAGDPSLEGAVFLLLGVVFALFVVSRLVAG